MLNGATFVSPRAGPFSRRRSAYLGLRLVCCLLPSPVRSDSLYFSSPHFSSPSPRVVSHQPAQPQTSAPYNARRLAIKAESESEAPPISSGPRVLCFPLLLAPFGFFFLLSSLSVEKRSGEDVGLLLSRRLQSMGQSSGIMFDTVTWPGKLKTQLKWQSRGQLFCISKALLWLFYTNYIR